MADPREKTLTDAAVAVTGDYDPHFAGPAETAVMETKLFLARWDALQKFDQIAVALALQKYHEKYDRNTPDELKEMRLDPVMPYVIPMILWCPNCGTQHIDAPEPHKPDCVLVRHPAMEVVCSCGAWQNPPHRSHRCHKCSWIWRPADVPTTGVAEIETRGKQDEQPVHGTINRVLQPHKFGVFRRAECAFNYCPVPGELCRERCRHPKTRDEYNRCDECAYIYGEHARSCSKFEAKMTHHPVGYVESNTHIGCHRSDKKWYYQNGDDPKATSHGPFGTEAECRKAAGLPE